MRRQTGARPLSRLGADTTGVTAIEFGLVAPVLLLLMVGIFDLAHTAYMTAALQGAVQKAGRDSSLQNSSTSVIDAAVVAQVRELDSSLSAPVITRRYFHDYNAAAANQFEPFVDTDGDHSCDHGESYTDTNGNSHWDSGDVNAGQGTAQDRTVYTVSVSYGRLFPLDRFINVPHQIKLSASTILANQPYAEQAAPQTRTCT